MQQSHTIIQTHFSFSFHFYTSELLSPVIWFKKAYIFRTVIEFHLLNHIVWAEQSVYGKLCSSHHLRNVGWYSTNCKHLTSSRNSRLNNSREFLLQYHVCNVNGNVDKVKVLPDEFDERDVNAATLHQHIIASSESGNQINSLRAALSYITIPEVTCKLAIATERMMNSSNHNARSRWCEMHVTFKSFEFLNEIWTYQRFAINWMIAVNDKFLLPTQRRIVCELK